MSGIYELNLEQARVLKDLEQLIREKTIPIVETIKWRTLGVKIEDNNVTGLGLHKQELSTLPESIGDLKSLQTLSLNENQLQMLPESFWNLKSLQTLDLSENQLRTLPESIGNLKSLEILLIGSNQLQMLPDSIGDLTSLQKLDLNENQLQMLPDSIGDLTSLQTLSLNENQLQMLPESIGDLISLQTLSLNENQLQMLPESIGDLSSLEQLFLHRNQLQMLPESIGDLSSLEQLFLLGNQLTTLPKSIGNLTSLQTLDLMSNRITTLLETLWRLKNLKILLLFGNPWEGEWVGIDRYDVPKVLEFCRQRAPISVFLSHSKSDDKKYYIKKITENLKKREEIRKVYSRGVQDIPESQLFLFIATQDSITDAQCLHELGLAITHGIGIIPIKGTDITFEELTHIDLRAEGHSYFNLKDKKGFEFDGDEANLEAFCGELYEYIKQYKRDFNLFDAESRKFDEERENVKITIEELFESVMFRKKLMENITQLEDLSEELENEQISPEKYVLKTGQLFKSHSK